MQVKMGHGGTLDPLATGVLIVGVGKGTKHLQKFLHCTKSYDAEMIFGAETDTYDSEGKVVARLGYNHITKESVEQNLDQFRGKIMQVPPVFSALSVNGKRLYEYAREGLEIPEIKSREVETERLNLTDWLEGGKHTFRWPKTEAPKEEKEAAKKLLHIEQEDDNKGTKRKRDADGTVMPKGTANGAADPDEAVLSPEPHAKKARASPEPAMSGALQSPNDAVPSTESAEVADATSSQNEAQPKVQQPLVEEVREPNVSSAEAEPAVEDGSEAPVARLEMTVTSGFYVRSLVHDLGRAVGSVAHLVSLVRTRQADFELGKNVLEFDDLEKGEEVWGPKVRAYLDEWNKAHGGV